MPGLTLDGADAFEQAVDDTIDDWTPSEAGYIVSNPMGYGPIIEFGRGPVTPTDAEVLRFEVDGEVVFTQRSGPVPPQPMLRPAVDETKAKMGSIATSSDTFDEFLVRSALYLERSAKRRTPIDTGTLRAKWQTRPL